jgi:hypothetical protein
MSEELIAWLTVDPLTREQAASLALDTPPNPNGKLPNGFHGLLANMDSALKFGQLRGWCSSGLPNGHMDRFDPARHDLNSVLIHRSSFAEWLTTTGRVAKFFHSPASDWSISEETSGYWPWGDHTTEALKHLAAAAERFWKRYDPNDQTTAPLSEHVVDWLVDQGVSRRTAEVMARILRADGLRTGPRT